MRLATTDWLHCRLTQSSSMIGAFLTRHELNPNEHAAAQAADAPELIDFTRSIPPMPSILPGFLSDALRRLAARTELGALMATALPGGSTIDRQVGAVWLASRFAHRLEPERIAVTNGTQGALLLLLESLVGRDGLLVAEMLSYGVLADLARRAHVRLEGLAIDAEGIIPEAFEAVCRRQRPRALYCNPTVQNPTTAVMPAERRLAVVEIARRHGVAIIEDDALGGLHPAAPPPIAALGPDVVWYVMGLTKCLAHGLRIAYLVGPSAQALDDVVGAVSRLSHWFPSPLAVAVVSDWIERGIAEKICSAIRIESIAREELARAILGSAIASQPGGMHVWLRLPARIDRRNLTSALKQTGILVRPADLFAVDGTPPPNAVRLSLSSPADRNSVARGLRLIGSALV